MRRIVGSLAFLLCLGALVFLTSRFGQDAIERYKRRVWLERQLEEIRVKAAETEGEEREARPTSYGTTFHRRTSRDIVLQRCYVLLQAGVPCDASTLPAPDLPPMPESLPDIPLHLQPDPILTLPKPDSFDHELFRQRE